MRYQLFIFPLYFKQYNHNWIKYSVILFDQVSQPTSPDCARAVLQFYKARLPGLPGVQTSLRTKCLKPRHPASPALKILITLMDSVLPLLCQPLPISWNDHITQMLQKKTCPPRPFASPSLRQLSAAAALLLAVGLSSFLVTPAPPAQPRGLGHSASAAVIWAQKQNSCPVSCNFSVSEKPCAYSQGTG